MIDNLAIVKAIEKYPLDFLGVRLVNKITGQKYIVASAYMRPYTGHEGVLIDLETGTRYSSVGIFGMNPEHFELCEGQGLRPSQIDVVLDYT